MQSSLDSILSIQVYPVKPCMEIYQVLVSHYHLFHINDMDIIPLSSIIYNENILCRLLFLLSLRSVVLWIACGLTAFIFQHNVVCLDIPFHISPSIVGVCHRIGNRIDCEVLSKKDHLLYLDCKDNHYELIPTNPNMKPYKIAVFFSGLEHSLAGSKYNMRVDELRSGVYALQAFAGLDYGKFNETNARDVSYEIYQTYKDKLPLQWAKRCEHWYTEFKRVEAGAEAWRRGDLEEYGRLSFESGWSSIHNWESGAPEQIKLYEIMRETAGIYGGRFSGAGFKGCCMALIDPSKTDVIREEVERKYLTAFPEMHGKYSFHLCESADGVGHKTED